MTTTDRGPQQGPPSTPTCRAPGPTSAGPTAFGGHGEGSPKATIIGVRAADGVALAADRRHVERPVVATERVDRIQEHGATLAAAVGEPGGVAGFHRTLADEIGRFRDDHDRAPTVDAVAEMASRVAASTKVDALVAARNGFGTAELRRVDDDGAVLQDEHAARGTGRATALGALDGVDRDAPVTDVADALRDVVASVHERDAESGPVGDVATLETQ